MLPDILTEKMAARQLLDAIRIHWNSLNPPFDFGFEVPRAGEPRDTDASVT